MAQARRRDSGFPVVERPVGKDEAAAMIADRYITSIAECEIYHTQLEFFEKEVNCRAMERDAALRENTESWM